MVTLNNNPSDNTNRYLIDANDHSAAKNDLHGDIPLVIYMITVSIRINQ